MVPFLRSYIIHVSHNIKYMWTCPNVNIQYVQCTCIVPTKVFVGMCVHTLLWECEQSVTNIHACTCTCPCCSARRFWLQPSLGQAWRQVTSCRTQEVICRVHCPVRVHGEDVGAAATCVSNDHYLMLLRKFTYACACWFVFFPGAPTPALCLLFSDWCFLQCSSNWLANTVPSVCVCCAVSSYILCVPFGYSFHQMLCMHMLISFLYLLLFSQDCSVRSVSVCWRTWSVCLGMPGRWWAYSPMTALSTSTTSMLVHVSVRIRCSCDVY